MTLLAGDNLAQIGEWARTAGIAGILAVLGGFYLRKRKDDREGWGVLIEALQRDVATVRSHHADCERRLTEVEAQLRGVHRQLVMHSSTSAVSFGIPSDAVRDAAERVTRIIDDDGREE